MQEIDCINNYINYTFDFNTVNEILQRWQLYDEIQIMNNSDNLKHIVKTNVSMQRMLSQTIFNISAGKLSYNENRKNALLSII